MNTIFGWIVAYRYGILLPIAVIEGPIISIIAGFLVGIGQMNFWIVLTLLALGDVIGDVALYCAGRFGGLKLIDRYGKFLKITRKQVERLESFFKNHAGKTILFGKWGHAFGLPILVSAGIAKEPPEKFVLLSIVGTIPKTLILMFIGIYFGSSYILIKHYLDYFVLGTIALTAIAATPYWFFSKKARELFSEPE